MHSKINTLLILFMLAIPILIVPGIMQAVDESESNSSEKTDSSNSLIDTTDDLKNQFPDGPEPTTYDEIRTADEMNSGVADPLIIERQGYYSTGSIVARTDIMENTQQNLILDTANNWKGSVAEVDVTDLITLYAVNGTFDEGIVGTNVNPNSTFPPRFHPYGWNATSNSTDAGQTQRATYDVAKFVVVENEGTKIGPSGKHYTHYAGTSIVWTQTIENKPQVDDFILSFDYLYLRGVLGTTGFTGNCSLAVFLNGDRVYSVNLPTLQYRGVWYGTGEKNITILNAPASFELMIGLVIDETLALNADEDYNGDSIPEGISNTVYITAYIDNVRFVSASPPSFESVDLQFHADVETEPITGSLGVGFAQIINPTYWIDSYVPISISANKSVIFTYESRLLSHRFSNSSYTTDINKQGVSFEIIHGQSTEIQAFSYLGSLMGYEENTLFIYYPTDWENVTVLNPFLSDITSQCTFFSTYFSIPESALSTLGWYEILSQSPNYAYDINVQIYDSDWTSETVFRPGNLTRPVISIQTIDQIPAILDMVDVSWYVPNGALWYNEVINNGIDGLIQGSSKILDISYAGPWQIEVFWTNGTEFAYDITSFNVYHVAELIADPDTIETYAGQTITGIVRYSDLDTGTYIKDELATVSGNWSLSTIFFTTNPVKNWWEVSLNTDDIGAGSFVVHVEASRPYYNTVACDLLIISINHTRLNSPNAPWTAGQWGSEVSLTFHFEVFSYSTATWNPVTNNSDVSVNFNWTAGYWNIFEESPGIYIIVVDTIALPADTYLIDITFEKPNHETQEMILTLIVTDAETVLFVPGGDSFEIGLTDTFNTTFSYRTSNDIGIENAATSVVYTGPSGGISWDIDEKGYGDYSIEFNAALSGTYVVTIGAFKESFQSASDSFFLVVRDITTNFTVLNGTAGIVSYGKEYKIVMSYTNGSGFGLADADVSIESVVPETGLSWGLTQQGEPGIYSIVFTPETSNTFTLLIRASLLNHQLQFSTFTITATAIPSTLTVLNSSSTISFDQNYTVFLHYKSEDFVGLENATLSIQNPSSIVGSTDFIDLKDGYYKVTLMPHEIGTFDLVFHAELPGYQSDTAGFALSATRIQTNLRTSGDISSGSIQYSNLYYLTIFYERTDLNQNVSNAGLDIEVSYEMGLNWTVQELDNGYLVILNANQTGSWTLTITANKANYATRSLQFVFVVTSIPIAVELAPITSVVEGRPFNIVINLTIQGSNTPISGASVSYRIYSSGTSGSGEFITLEESQTPGIYSGTFTFPLYIDTTTYTLEVLVQKDNFLLSGGSAKFSISKTIDIVLRWTPLISLSGISIAAIIGSVVGLQIYSTRKKRRNLAALQVKKRFDDVSNILGILVLHKKSGLPIFSKILRGGFEEAMVSAFITAITNFRSEFGMDEKHWDFNVIPISDIISAVPTHSLIVAFITVRPPSKYQETGMEAFGRAVGAMFDDQYEEIRSVGMDIEHSRILENLFYDLLDGFLTESYRISKDVTFPKEMKCLVSTAQQLEGAEGFRLEDLAKGMATCGIEESHAYKLVMDAIEDNKLEVVNGHIPEGRISGPFMDRKFVEDEADEDEY